MVDIKLYDCANCNAEGTKKWVSYNLIINDGPTQEFDSLSKAVDAIVDWKDRYEDMPSQ